MAKDEMSRPGVELGMRSVSRMMLGIFLLCGVPSCREAPTQPPADSASTSSAPSAHAMEIPETASSAEAAPDPFVPVMSDEALGKLIESLSEPTGDFPSDNFVSNETSYLHVAEALADERLRGKAYVGVGPEQNLTYVALMRPSMAYLVDIRRQNMLQHMVFRALAEEARDRATFLARLTGRDFGCCGIATPHMATFEEIADALAKLDPSEERVGQEVKRTIALMDRLGVRRKAGDEADVRKILQAFASKGLDLAYSMKGSGRRYPEVRKLLSMTDPSGSHRSFVADEESFSTLQGAYRANRIVPVVGDFSGDRALRGIAKDMKDRSLVLGAFYTSNVEQYLFEGGTYGKFVDNVRSFPIDDTSCFVRVWFDQGRAHPEQQEGHRTTSLVMPMEPFLERQSKRPFPTYWHVTNGK